MALTASALADDVAVLLQRVQNDLFDVGADLCLPLAQEYGHEPLRVGPVGQRARGGDATATTTSCRS